MEIDWRREVNEATAVKFICDGCEGEFAVVTYVDRRLLCPACAGSLGLGGRQISYEAILESLLFEMRHRLDEWATALEEFSRLRAREIAAAPAIPSGAAWERLVQRYRQLEEYYLALHAIFRRQGHPIPEPGWRSAYVERVVNCGFASKLGS